MSQLKGHALLHEGSPHTDEGYLINTALVGSGGIGRGKCECGALSDWLGSGNARKQWHREHKQRIRELEGAS